MACHRAALIQPVFGRFGILIYSRSSGRSRYYNRVRDMEVNYAREHFLGVPFALYSEAILKFDQNFMRHDDYQMFILD